MRHGRIAALGGMLLGLAASASAAEPSFGDWLAQGKPVIDIRARYESVDDKSKNLFGVADTMRLRLGYESTAWHGFGVVFDFDEVLDLVAADHNNTRNGKTAYPTIADPQMLALNRLQITYATDMDTKIVVGRQRLQFGDQRFIGNSGWRQHEQTFDAVTAVNTSFKDLLLTYSYVDRVNRVYGPNDPEPASGPAGYFNSNSHLFNAIYSGVPALKLEGYVYLLDLRQRGPAASVLATSKLSTATYGARGEYRLEFSSGLTGQINGAFAHQQNYADNPLVLDLDYWLAEGSISYRSFTLLIGNEVMGGNGTIGFSTPLATLHPFDGLADMFTATPANGIDDVYMKANYRFDGLLKTKSVTMALAYHDFRSDHAGVGIGSEWDASLELAVDQHTSFLLGVADYQGAGLGFGGFKDKVVVWAQAAYRL